MAALLFICMITLVVRYPLVEHERYQSDSYSIHFFAQTIVDEGHALWTFTPLSYLGYYPLSYPSGAPFFLAEISAMTGLSVEVSILLMGMVLGILFVLTVYCLAREFIKRPEFAIAAALLATLAPRFVDTTYWVGSARGPLVVIMSLALLAFLRTKSPRDWRLLAVGMVFVAGSLTIHHMAVLIVVFAMAYVWASLTDTLRERIKWVKGRTVNVAFVTTIAVSMTAASYLSLDYSLTYFERSFILSDYVFDFEPSVLSGIMNMVVSYTHQIGLIMIFCIAGVVRILMSERTKGRSLFLVTLLLSIIPLLGNPLYISMLILPLAAIIGTMWFMTMMSNDRRGKVTRAVFVALVVASLALPVWSTHWWNANESISGDRVEVEDISSNDSNYIRSTGPDLYYVSNAEVISLRLSALSGASFLRPGLPMAVSGDVTEVQIKGNMSWSESSFPMNLYYWFKYDQEDYGYYVLRGLMMSGVEYFDGGSEVNQYGHDIFANHPKFAVAVDLNFEDEFAGRWDIVDSTFMKEVKTAEIVADGDPLESYVIYSSERTAIYYVNVPL